MRTLSQHGTEKKKHKNVCKVSMCQWFVCIANMCSGNWVALLCKHESQIKITLSIVGFTVSTVKKTSQMEKKGKKDERNLMKCHRGGI